MPLTAVILICLPCLLIGTVLGLDLYLRHFPEKCDDLWRLPKPSSLRLMSWSEPDAG